jgi:hypothetical protein
VTIGLNLHRRIIKLKREMSEECEIFSKSIYPKTINLLYVGDAPQGKGMMHKRWPCAMVIGIIGC